MDDNWSAKIARNGKPNISKSSGSPPKENWTSKSRKQTHWINTWHDPITRRRRRRKERKISVLRVNLTISRVYINLDANTRIVTRTDEDTNADMNTLCTAHGI